MVLYILVCIILFLKRVINLSKSHDFPPIFDEQSRILILGSFPSVKSREESFYYANPQNRFWRLLSKLLEEPLPLSINDKVVMLKKHRIAIWDVIGSCDIVGSSDSSITNVKPVDLSIVLEKANIESIFANGNKAYELYNKYIYPDVKREIIKLPSTSPANASYSIEKLVLQWNKILES